MRLSQEIGNRTENLQQGWIILSILYASLWLIVRGINVLKMIRPTGLLLAAFTLLTGQSCFAIDASSSDANGENAVRDVLMSLEKSFADGQAENAAKLFTEDAIFIGQDGEQTAGRSAIRQRLDGAFKLGSAKQLNLHPTRISFPASNVALVIGETSQKTDGGSAPATRFSMVMVKAADTWQINEANEVATNDSYQQLEALDWLTGTWNVEGPNGRVFLDAEWAPNHRFIVLKINHDEQTKPKVDTQIIGWDPQKNSLVSWHFEANGGFGSGTWTWLPEQKSWVVDVSGVTPDGGNTRAMNSFTLNDKDSFSWQAVRRSLDGVPVANTTPLTARRVKR